MQEDTRATLVSFDFEKKVEQQIPIEAFKTAMGRGEFVWLDLEFTTPEEARAWIDKLDVLNEEVMEDALHNEPRTRLARYDEHLHLVVSGCRERGMQFDLERVDVVIGEQYLITLHKGDVSFLEGVRREYHSDFLRFAKSPSFL